MSDRTPVKRILILAANPKDAIRRRLDEEVREISDGLKQSRHRDYFDLQQRWAVRSKDIRRALLDLDPQIVHFCGYGDGANGLAVENEAGQLQWIPPQALVDLFQHFTGIECVLLNACYSEEQAAAISQYIPYVIGMDQQIGDRAAIEFAVGFYDALGAGRSYEQAFQLGRSAIPLNNLPGDLAPRIKHQVAPKPQIDESSIKPNERNFERQNHQQQRIPSPHSAPASTPRQPANKAPDRTPNRTSNRTPAKTPEANRRKPASPAQQRRVHPNRTLAQTSQRIWWVLVAIVLVWVVIGECPIPDARSSELWGAVLTLGAVGGLVSALAEAIAQRQLRSTPQADQLILNCLIGMVAGALAWLIATSVTDTIAPGAMTRTGFLVGFCAGLVVAVVLLGRITALRQR